MKPGVLQQLTKSSQSWMSLGDAYMANNSRFLRHGIPAAVLSLKTLALPLTKHSPPVEERDYILSAAGWRATTDALFSAVLQIGCVFSTMPDRLMTSRSQGKNSGSAASLRFSDQCWQNTDLS